MEPGTKLHYHIDSGRRTYCNQEGIEIRFNICIQKPEIGGRPIYSGKIIDLQERAYVICKSELEWHTSEWISGNKAKICLSIGFCIDPEFVSLYSNRELEITNEYFISSWKTKNSNDILDIVNKLNPFKKYLLNLNFTAGYNKMEKYVYDIVHQHFKEKNISFPDNAFSIEFFRNTSDKIIIEYDKQLKKSPLFSILSYFTDSDAPVFFTNIDLDSYKYKEILDENVFSIYKPISGSHIVFDSSKYHGGHNALYKGNPPAALKINIWDISKNGYVYENTDLPIFDGTFSSEYNDKIQTIDFVYKENVLEQILYENEIDDIIINKLLIENYDCDLLKINSLKKPHLNLSSLFDKYGLFSHDIYPFLKDADHILLTSNRFYKKKLLRKIISPDVCYWIINESEKKNNFIDSPYSNFQNYMTLEFLPSVLNYVLFASNYWLSQIRNIYDFEKQPINISIKDIFLTRIDKPILSKYKEDGSFLTIFIQLNDSRDFENGELLFKEDNIVLDQGDMIVYSGKNKRLKDTVLSGVKYGLVIITEILFT